VLAIDADINQHLAQTLGSSSNPEKSSLADSIPLIKTYLRGKNHRIPDNASMIKTTPPGTGSNLLRISNRNPIMDTCAQIMGNISLLSVGGFQEEDLGTKCFHAKTGAVELVLNHLIDREDEYVLVDMTAGADVFASGLFTKFDVTCIVVEPTEKSVSVFHQYKKYAEGFDVKIVAVGNKILDASDEMFLRQSIGDALIASFSHSSFVKQQDRGVALPILELEEQNRAVLEHVHTYLDQQKKNWNKLYVQACEFHLKNAESWGNAATGKNLSEQIDPDFMLNP
jgi:CO dehydrogenase maturation factor